MENIEELRELIRAENANREPPENECSINTKDIVSAQYEQNRQQIAKDDNFIKLTQEITDRAVKAELEKDALSILNQEQKNALARHLFELEKQKLEFRQKKEKKIILEDIKADLQNKRIEALKKRYGYMYKPNESFIPSKFHNMQKELVNKWESTTVNTKKIIKGCIRILFYGGLAVLIGIFGWNIIKWVLSNADKLQTLT